VVRDLKHGRWALSIAILGLIVLSGDARWLAVGSVAAGWFVVLPRLRLRARHRPWVEGGALLLGGALCYALGVRVSFVRDLGGGHQDLGAWGLPLTALWIVLVARATRALHRLAPPGTFLRVSWLVCLTFLLIGWLQLQALPFALALGAALLVGLTAALRGGAVLSPLRAEGVGVLLALLTITGVLKTSATVALLAPIALLGLPPLAARYALGIAARPARALPTPGRLLALYVLLSALSLLGVVWSQWPDWALPATLAVGAAPSLPFLLTRAGAEAGSWLPDAGRLSLFGVPFHRLGFEAALERAERFAGGTAPRLVATPDTTALMRARTDRALRDCYARADLVTADGTGIVWAARWLGAPLPDRVTGIDLMTALCERAALKGQRVYLLGARPGVAEAAAARLRARFPGLRVAGAEHGYFSDDAAAVARVRAARPDLLFVGMGVPRQERWLVQHRQALGVPVMMGVGGSFDVLSGRLRRAPRAWQRLGLEWLYRLCLEPKRLGRALCIPVFLGRVLWLKGCLALQKSLGSTTSVSSS